MQTLRKINAILRNIVLMLGTVYVICRLVDDGKKEYTSDKEGFQTEEFDDIW